jgi:hypothetical protein
MNGINAASKCYKKAAEVSPTDNQICNACSLSMRCLSEILNYMLAVTKQEKITKLKDKVEEWEKNLEICKNAYSESEKGKNFIQSLYKMIMCTENFEEYKKYNTWEEKRDLKECIDDLIEIAKNIEGPLQKVIGDATKQMNYCKSETLYKGTETRPFLKKDMYQELKIDNSVEQKIESSSTLEPKDKHRILKLLLEHPLSVGLIVTVIGGIILKRIYP